MPSSPTHWVQTFSGRAYEIFCVVLGSIDKGMKPCEGRLVEFAQEVLGLLYDRRNNEMQCFFVLLHTKQNKEDN